MDIIDKLKVIKKALGVTQTQLAMKLGVSFVSFNNWWNGKVIPHQKKQKAIDGLFLEVTGQKNIPESVLLDKKKNIKLRAGKHKKLLLEILKNKDIKDQFVLTLTYHTNSIEGSTLTEPDTSAILFDNIALSNKSLIEQLEVKNHQAALEYVFEYISNNGKINEALVLKLHSILMNGIQSDAGRYRNHGVRIVGVNLVTANHLKIHELINKLISKYSRNNKDVIASASLVHSEFEKIHPFSDGNGRVGRLLMNAMLLKLNFAPAIIRQERKQLYYTYLFKSQVKGDLSQLESFLYNAVDEGFNILERKNR